MKSSILIVPFLLAAALTAVPRARAQRPEREEQERREAPKKLQPKPKPKPRPRPKPSPKPRPKPRPAPGRPNVPWRPRPQPRPPVQPRPSAPARPKASPPREEARPVETPRPAHARPLPKPHPIADPKHFLRRWSPPPAPKTGPRGGALTAAPVSRPPIAAHAAVLGNRAVVSTILSNQQSEIQPNRYYWHRDGGWDYVHYYSGGAHWYGFYVGPNYYWSRYHEGRWWWYDPGAQRYVYYNDGAWWWQNPAQPQTVYVYQNNAYVQYAPAPAGSDPNVVVNTASAEPPAPVYRSDVDAPNYEVKPNASRFALVIGVENYAELPPAEFAERDAEAVRAHLTALGYPDRNVVVLTSSQAARSSVVKYVESWLPEHLTADSRLFVYFSGHGAPDPKTGEAYLMPWDGDAEYLRDTGYPIKRLYEKLNALPAREIVVVLDSCFSGAGGRSVLVAGARPLITKVDAGRDRTGRLVVFAASGPDEITGALPAQGHGLFTYYFLKGLNGEAAATADGVTVQALFDDLSPNVQDAARRDNRDQTPQLIVPPDGQRRMLIKDLR